ncbi:hypothetical protein ACFQ4C_05440 [Larkinella insperata]|uniref:Uncharacterized protein n=1 Tax=Larkinella insperata TaxID=332158 RepID=A0ABW3Q140_9BACT|nr:hypothetical protein [Larkinella insperata]
MNARPKPNRYYMMSNGPALMTEWSLKELKPTDSPLPIKLTKQWLLAFGFRPDARGQYWTLEDCRLIPGVNCWLCVHSRRYLRFVHELQDLFDDLYKYTELRLKTGLNSLHVPTILPTSVRASKL